MLGGVQGGGSVAVRGPGEWASEVEALRVKVVDLEEQLKQVRVCVQMCVCVRAPSPIH